MTKEKLIIILTVFIDVVGIGIVIPMLPFYVKSFSASPLMVTLLFSVFSLCAFFSAPFLGALSDRIGRRPTLIISIASTTLGWLVFAAANSLWLLFLGRIIDGMAAGNFPIAQSYLVDIAKDEKERTANLGVIGAVFGVAFIVGPALGAALGAISLALPFWIVGGLALVNTISAFFFLPETNKVLDKSKPISFNPLLPLKKAVQDEVLRSRYLAYFLFGMAIAVQQSVFALYLDGVFHFRSVVVSGIFAVMGILMALNQGVLLKNFWLKKFTEIFLEKWMLLAFAGGLLLIALPWMGIFFVGLFFTLIAQSIIRIVISSRVSSLAGEQKRGEALGIMSSVFSVAMIFGPILAGWLFQNHPSFPYVLGGIFAFTAFVVMVKSGGEKKIEPLPVEIKI